MGETAMTTPWWFRPLGRLLALCGKAKRLALAARAIEPWALVAAMAPRCALVAG
jgi:hypothetical protein